MRIAIIGSRNADRQNIAEHLPPDVTEIVSGGARGIDTQAAQYAIANGIRLTEFLPEYEKYNRGAPLKRNEQIAQYADEALVFWDGRSRGTKHTIDLFRKLGKSVKIIMV